MKKILIILIVVLVLSCAVFAQDDFLDYSTPQMATPKIKDINLLDFIQSVTVQIVVPTDRHFRTLSWYELEEGQVDREKLDRDKEQWGYKWFIDGWKVEKGNWCTDKEAKEVKICGSGVIVYSKMPDGNYDMKDKSFAETYYSTYILTNAHVVDILVDYKLTEKKWGTSREPLDIYEPGFLVEKTYPPGISVKGDAKPYEQAYFIAKTNYITIKHSVDQLYRVEAKIVAFDRALDVALLKLKNVFGLPYAVWRGTPCRVGEEVYICGAPLALPFSIDKGRINQVNLDLGDDGVRNSIIWDNQVKLDIAAAPGSSGSGIFDVNGNLIAEEHGVMVHNGNYISGGHLAISGMAIREWLLWNGFAFTVFQEPYGRVFVK